MDWSKDEECVIMITSYEANHIYFNIQEPSPIQNIHQRPIRYQPVCFSNG